MKKIFIFLALCFFQSRLVAQVPQLVDNITSGSFNSWIGYSASFGGKLIFIVDSASSVPTGTQLWITDGSTTGSHFIRTFARSDFAGFKVLNNKAYFIANDSIHGSELWVTDGTAAGTNMVKDIWPGVHSSIVAYFNVLAVMGGKLFFAANDSIHGAELWVSDGTYSGTYMVTDIDTGFGVSSLFGEVVATNNKLFFPVNGGTYDNDLWISDGTAAGTSLLGTLGGVKASIYNLIVSSNKVYFSVKVFNPNPSTPPIVNFYVSDGTLPGTAVLRGDLENTFSYAEMGGKLYLYANTNPVLARDPGLWITDGTMAGTILVKDRILVTCGSFSMATFGNNVYFGSLGTKYNANELWVSDGTTTGTTSLKDFSAAGISAPPPSSLIVNGSYLYFKAWDSISQRINIWISDGTATGTHVIDYPGANSHYNSDNACNWMLAPVTLVDSTLYFGIDYDTVNTGFELYKLSRPNSVPNVSLSQTNFVIFPNPASNSYQVKYSFTAPVNCTLDIVDMNGRIIQHLCENKEVSSGTSVFTYSTAQIPDGVYFLRLQTSHEVQVEKLVVQH